MEKCKDDLQREFYIQMTKRYQWRLAKLSPNEYYDYITTGIYPLKDIIPSAQVDNEKGN